MQLVLAGLLVVAQQILQVVQAEAQPAILGEEAAEVLVVVTQHTMEPLTETMVHKVWMSQDYLLR
jgi:hypothetical protein